MRGMGANGPTSMSRATDGDGLAMPDSEGYIGTGGDEFRPLPWPQFEVPGPAIGALPSRETWIGVQWAPGQGGDTPGGGGAAMTFGETQPVETAWITDGVVTTPAAMHKPGSVGYSGARRSRA